MVKSRMTKRQYSTKHSTKKIEQYEPHPSCYSCQKSRDKSYSVIPHDRGMKDGVLTTANIKKSVVFFFQSRIQIAIQSNSFTSATLPNISTWLFQPRTQIYIYNNSFNDVNTFKSVFMFQPIAKTQISPHSPIKHFYLI